MASGGFGESNITAVSSETTWILFCNKKYFSVGTLSMLLSSDTLNNNVRLSVAKTNSFSGRTLMTKLKKLLSPLVT